jgi:hypothetical protein
MWSALSNERTGLPFTICDTVVKVKVAKVILRLTVGQSVSLGVEPHLGLMTGYLLLFVTVLFLWGALSDERTGLSFVYDASPRQRSLSWVRVPWISRPYFTVSVLRLSFSSPPTTCRVTVEVFDPGGNKVDSLCSLGADHIENTASKYPPLFHANIA